MNQSFKRWPSGLLRYDSGLRGDRDSATPRIDNSADFIIMLSNCSTCRFHTSHQHHCTDIGCAVNPSYWALWRHLHSLPPELEGASLINYCGDYQLNAPISTTSTVEKLVGFWDYKVSFVSATYRIQIELNEAQLIGSYIIPANNDSLFEFAVYEFTGRGRPVITIAQIAQLLPNSSYRAVLSGRLDNERLITGYFVDVDDNRGTFKMMKQ